MLIRKLFSALLAVSMLPISWTVADAATCLRWGSIGGSKTCYLWSTGSEVCDATSTGVGNNNDCDPTLGTCPTLTCSAFGTVDVGDGLCDPNQIDADCAIQGVAFCVNKPGNARKAQGQPFTLDAFLTATQDIEACTRNGKCTNSISLNPALTDDICINPNWHFLTFTAEVFNAQITVCPGGYDVNNQCCADNQRNFDGTCTTAGTEVHADQRCTVDLTNYHPGDKIPYSCCDLAARDPLTGQCPQL